MLSLYIHIPFCERKCSYCNFFISPLEWLTEKETFIKKYTDSLLNEIKYWSEIYPWAQIKTIYFWWWTPLKLGKENILAIIDKIAECFDLEYMEELSIELNPDPFDEVQDFITTVNKKYPNFFRIRFSLGIQSLDDETLKLTGRWYTFNQIALFLRQLVNIKQPTNVFNFDFISFWVKEKFWDLHRLNFFNDFIWSGYVDSLSLYTLELFPWSKDFGTLSSDENMIYNEFSYLKDLILDNNFRRYELSNFSLLWKESIHNKVYWEMWNYIWLWMNASSFLSHENANVFSKKMGIENSNYIRFTNVNSWDKYFNNEYVDKDKIIVQSENDFLIEKFFLAMRTNQWVKLEDFGLVLVKDYQKKVDEYIKDGFAIQKHDKVILSDQGMDVYNHIITNLVETF